MEHPYYANGNDRCHQQPGFLESIPLWLVTLLGSLFITVLAFIMILTVYGRFFKLYMYAALSPIALSSFAGESTSFIGKSFLKSYIGVCMEGSRGGAGLHHLHRLCLQRNACH